MNAFITGITGQTGSYLAELLLSKNIHVIGLVRRSSYPNTDRIRSIKEKIILEEGDITDSISVFNVIQKYKPDYIFHLAAQSYVATSFKQPAYTIDVNIGGTLNILEAIRLCSPQTRLLHSGTSEMYGNNYLVKKDGVLWSKEAVKMVRTDDTWKAFQDENTEFKPDSPYAVSKVAAHQLLQLYRKAYNIFAVGAIAFNHESPRRGDEFVTKKITNYVRNSVINGDLLQRGMKIGPNFPKLKLGNIKASRDWSHAKDVAEGYWLALNHTVPDDYVFASGETRTVEEFLETAFSSKNLNWKDFVEIDESLKRPVDVEYLLGDSSKARRVLDWKPKYNFKQLIQDMLEN